MTENHSSPWRTALTGIEPDRIVVRGRDLSDLIGRLTFAEMTLLLMKGTEVEPGEARMLDAIMVAILDHGISPSSTVSRYLASCGVPIQTAVAGGVLSFGDIHGGAGEQFAQLLQQALATGGEPDDLARDIVRSHREKRQVLPGFGHPQHPEGDPRVPRLIQIAQETGVFGDHLRLACHIEAELEAVVGREIAMNIDGLLGAVTLDLGLDWRLTRPLLFGPRTLGLAAHVIEEWDREPGWRHVPAEDIHYDGPMPTDL